MNIEDILNKNKVLIDYLKTIIDGYLIKAEYSTNDNDKRVIIVQEQAGNKVVFFDKDTPPLFNYYMINIYGLSIQENKETSLILGELIGKSITFKFNNKLWQIIFQQMSNPQTIVYEDIRRVGYSMIFKCIVNKVEGD